MGSCKSVPKHWPGLPSTSQLRPRLFHYPPGLREAAHKHDRPHVSFVLAGSFREEVASEEATLSHGSAAVRNEGARHAVQIGPAGALNFSLDLAEWPLPDCPRSGALLLTRPGAAADIFARLATGHVPVARERLGSGMERPLPRNPPPWLEGIARRLMERPWDNSIRALSDERGIHRVHLARCFQRFYGLPPSIFRRRAMTAHALHTAMFDGGSLARAAAEAGFTDQSHMARALKETCGVRASHLQSVLVNEVSSVQSTN